MTHKIIGLYAGTFDPITKGHLDIVQRATKVVDHLIIAVAKNAGKDPLFTLEERSKMAQETIKNEIKSSRATIEVKPFDTLLMQFADEVGATAVIRGLRTVSDFEYEYQMAGMNRHLKPDIEVMFLMASNRYQHISSRFVKEICMLGGNVTDFVSSNVHQALLKKKEHNN